MKNYKSKYKAGTHFPPISVSPLLGVTGVTMGVALVVASGVAVGVTTGVVTGFGGS